MNKKVAIILVNWNSYELTNDCIHSLKTSVYTDFDIIVADNGSADHSGDRLKHEHPEIILLKAAENLGFTGGNNLGLHYSLNNNYTYSLLLNNDTFIEPRFLDVLASYMELHKETGVIQPRIFYEHDRSLLWNGGSYYNAFLGITYTKGLNKKSGPVFEKIKKVDWVTGCAFFTRNSILKKSGLLAANFFIYYEDVDLSFRIKKLGYKLIYHPEAVIYHIAGMANRSKTKGKEGYLNPVVHYLGERNKLWLLKQYTPWYCVPTAFLFNFFHATGVIAYFALRMRLKKLRSFLNGIKDGLSGSIKYKW